MTLTLFWVWRCEGLAVSCKLWWLISAIWSLCNNVSLPFPPVCNVCLAQRAWCICLHAQVWTHLQFPVPIFMNYRLKYASFRHAASCFDEATQWKQPGFKDLNSRCFRTSIIPQWYGLRRGQLELCLSWTRPSAAWWASHGPLINYTFHNSYNKQIGGTGPKELWMALERNQRLSVAKSLILCPLTDTQEHLTLLRLYNLPEEEELAASVYVCLLSTKTC